MTGDFTDFNPFALDSDSDYARWRAWKLHDYPADGAALQVDVADPGQLSAGEYRALLARIRKANMAFYRAAQPPVVDKPVIRALGRQFGLDRLDMNLRADEDSITSIRVVAQQPGTHYIPYTSRPLNWHTDGYYNRPEEMVRAIIMHCASAAASGGENVFLDPEIAYILLRDENPDYIRALMQPDAMTIPANIEGDNQIRDDQPGPVFSVENATGALHMRYTARTRSIRWKQDSTLENAVTMLRELLDSNLPWLIRQPLAAGQGIICNNVLHRREAFSDDLQQPRLLYRARYHDRIRGSFTGRECLGDAACSG